METPEAPLATELLLEKTISDPTQLTVLKKSQLISSLSRYGIYMHTFVEFSKPFEDAFAYGYHMFNTKHPVTQMLIRVLSLFALSKIRKILSSDRLGDLHDALYSVVLYNKTWEEWEDHLRRFWLMARQTELFLGDNLEDLVPSKEEFVPGSLEDILFDWGPRGEKMDDVQPFGEPLE